VPRTPGATERTAIERIVEIIPRLSSRQLYAMDNYVAGVSALRRILVQEGDESVLDAVEDFPTLSADELREALKADAAGATEAALDDVTKVMELVPRLNKRELNALLVYVNGVAEMKKALRKPSHATMDDHD
jgi:hypothetical protein